MPDAVASYSRQPPLGAKLSLLPRRKESYGPYNWNLSLEIFKDRWRTRVNYSSLLKRAYFLPLSDTISQSRTSPTLRPSSETIDSGIVARTEVDVVVAFETVDLLPTNCILCHRCLIGISLLSYLRYHKLIYGNVGIVTYANDNV